MRRRSQVLRVMIVVIGLMAEGIAVPHGALAQSVTAPHPVLNGAERLAREIELQEIEKQLQQGAEARRNFEAELATLRNDRAAMIQRTIDLAAAIKSLEARITATEDRLRDLMADADQIAHDLEARRSVIVSLLSGLQRIGQMPPPIVLADPDDLLSTVRGAMLLGAALPDLTEASKHLAAELEKKMAIRHEIESERQSIKQDIAHLVTERQHLDVMLEARQHDELTTQTQLSDQAAAVAALAAKSQSLKDLLGHVESEVGAVVQATDAAAESAAETAEDAQAAEASGRKDERAKLVADAFRDPSRIAPKVAFSELKGLLRQIVVGKIVRGFNEKDQVGNLAKGLSVQTRPGAMISTPSDAWVSYAGPFRSFGQLLILNAGGGYYILLAGMDRMTVGLGQFVLAGQPVAVMAGSTGAESGTASFEPPTPTLYIEFRKDGTPFDPAPWLASGSFEKVKE